MPADHASRSARDQLSDLAADSAAGDGGTGWDGLADLPDAVDARSAAVLMLFGEGARGPDLLLTERAATMRSHAGQPAFPGGSIDPGEGIVEAALREGQEETGLDPASVLPVALTISERLSATSCVPMSRSPRENQVVSAPYAPISAITCQVSARRPQPRSSSPPRPRVYMIVSRSGQIRSPCSVMSSAVLPTTVITASG